MTATGTHKAQSKFHINARLYSAEMDFNWLGKNPIGSYMLATIPRSGSTYCAIRLWQTGLLGAPMEYLNFHVIDDLLQRLGYQVSEKDHMNIKQMNGYWRDVQRLRSSPNGVFGYKMFIENYVKMARCVPGFLRKITPHYVIYLTRRDVLGQAMSYSRAMRSKVWFADVPNTPIVDYDYVHIKTCLRSIKRQKSAWESIFELTGIKPIRIAYEDLANSSLTVVDDVLNAMGIKLDESRAISIPMINRQIDGVSGEWRERFTEDSFKDVNAEVLQA